MKLTNWLVGCMAVYGFNATSTDNVIYRRSHICVSWISHNSNPTFFPKPILLFSHASAEVVKLTKELK